MPPFSVSISVLAALPAAPPITAVPVSFLLLTPAASAVSALVTPSVPITAPACLIFAFSNSICFAYQQTGHQATYTALHAKCVVSTRAYTMQLVTSFMCPSAMCQYELSAPDSPCKCCCCCAAYMCSAYAWHWCCLLLAARYTQHVSSVHVLAAIFSHLLGLCHQHLSSRHARYDAPCWCQTDLLCQSWEHAQHLTLLASVGLTACQCLASGPDHPARTGALASLPSSHPLCHLLSKQGIL